MRKLFKSKLLLSVLLIAIAGYLSFVALPNLYDSQSSTIQVVEFISDVAVGTEIKASMLTEKTIGEYGIDKGVITDASSIVGKYAAGEIRRETLLYPDQFVDSFEEADGAVDTLLKDGEQLITLRLSSAAAATGGLIKPGQFVDVYSQAESAETDIYGGYDESITMELQQILTHVRVYKLQNNALEDISELQRQWKSLLEKDDGSDQDFDSSMIPAYVTLIVTSEQALSLVNQEYDGTIHLVLYPN